MFPNEINGWMWMGYTRKSSSTWGGTIQQVGGPERTNTEGGLVTSRDFFFRCFGYNNSRLACLWTPGLTPASSLSLFSGFLPWTESYTTDIPGSEVFRLGLSHATRIPSSPTCRWLVMGLLSYHDHMSQFHDIAPFIYLYTYSIVLSLWRTLAIQKQ